MLSWGHFAWRSWWLCEIIYRHDFRNHVERGLQGSGLKEMM